MPQEITIVPLMINGMKRLPAGVDMRLNRFFTLNFCFFTPKFLLFLHRFFGFFYTNIFAFFTPKSLFLDHFLNQILKFRKRFLKKIVVKNCCKKLV